jgi:hypothetical protein
MLPLKLERIVVMVLIIMAANGTFVNAQRLQPGDLAFLPDVCKYTWDGPYRDAFGMGIDHFGKFKDHPEYHQLYYYYNLLGRDLVHMHHY